jgi:glycosyltransferase involved in cell wall biosynthesis
VTTERQEPSPRSSGERRGDGVAGPSADWVAYVGPFKYPWGEAASRRVHGIAMSLVAGGRDVVVACGEQRPGVLSKEQTGVSGGGTLYRIGLGELPEPGQSVLAKAQRVYWEWGRRTVAWLDAQRRKPACVVVYGGNVQFMQRLRPWARVNRVPLVVDVVEWYSPRQLQGGVLGPAHIGAKAALLYHYPRCAGVIAISSMLEAYYRNRGASVLRIPPTADVHATQVHRKQEPKDGRLRLIYTGTPGKKDLLDRIISAVNRVDPAGSSLELSILGPTSEEVGRMMGVERLPAAIKCLGRVPQAEVVDALQNSDFSVLIREPAKFAQAGFPTKFVESLSAGVPAIANLTSDIGLYMRDGFEGLVSEDHSVGALESSIARAARLSIEQRTAMSRHARTRAAGAFDYRSYVHPLVEFLDNVQEAVRATGAR